MTADKVKELLEGVFQCYKQAQQYLLEPEHLVIDPEYIFYSTAQKKWKIPYCGGYKKGVMDGVARVLECLMDYMDGADQKLCRQIYGLHGMAQAGNCHLQDILAGVVQEEKHRLWKLKRRKKSGKQKESRRKAEQGGRIKNDQGFC